MSYKLRVCTDRLERDTRTVTHPSPRSKSATVDAMATLNITYQGRSGSVYVGDTITLTDARRIALEVLRTGSLGMDMKHAYLGDSALDQFVLDSHQENGETTFYLRPKVPFGGN